MNEHVSPGAQESVDESLEESLSRLPGEARTLAAQGNKAARYAAESRYGYLGGLMNMEVIEAEDGKSVLTAEVTPNVLNGYGYVHGGMLFTLADYAMGATARTLVEKGSSPVTLEAKITYTSNVREGRLLALCEALHQTKRLIMLETRITNADTKELVAIIAGTFYVIREEGENGS